MTVVVGVLLALGAFVLYTWSNPVHYNQYTHFVWQADAFLHGRVSFDYPVPAGTIGRPQNDYFQDVYPLTDAAGQPTGQVLLPFPPLPALVLVPFVALFGLFTDQEAIAIGVAAVGVALAWWMLGALRIRTAVRVLTTLVFATGTVWWWAAAVGSTWYFAHQVAVAGLAARRGRGAARRPARGDGGRVVAADRRRDREPRTAPAASGRGSGRSTGRRCSRGCCSGSPRPLGCRSCSPHRSSSSSAAGGRGCAGPSRRPSAGSCRSPRSCSTPG